MAINGDVKWVVNLLFIALTFALAFFWRLGLKLGRSDKAIAVNNGRLQAQKIGILQRSWQGKNKAIALNPSDIAKLEQNVRHTQDAVRIHGAGGPYTCPWGESCRFQSTAMYDLEPLEYLTGKAYSSQFVYYPDALVPNPITLKQVIEYIREVKYGNYRAVETSLDVQKYLLRTHIDAATSYTENRIMGTAAMRKTHKYPDTWKADTRMTQAEQLSVNSNLLHF